MSVPARPARALSRRSNRHSRRRTDGAQEGTRLVAERPRLEPEDARREALRRPGRDGGGDPPPPPRPPPPPPPRGGGRPGPHPPPAHPPPRRPPDPRRAPPPLAPAH